MTLTGMFKDFCKAVFFVSVFALLTWLMVRVYFADTKVRDESAEKFRQANVGARE